MNKSIKCCVYIVKDNENSSDNSSTSAEYQEFFNNRPRFCDLGDDPSFYCSEKYKAEVTWGVCRHNVRQGLTPIDEIHFVACDKTIPHFWKYYYIGYGIVSDTISHKDIWEKNEYSVYQKYFNNLIKPVGSNYTHFEKIPSLYWHDDWKMRISSEQRLKKLSEIEEDLEHGICGYSTKRKIDEKGVSSKFPFGKNYIIFDKKRSHFIIDNPIYVAEVKWDGRDLFTEWISKSIQSLFSNGQLKDSFTHKGRQHPAFNMSAENADKLKKLL